MKKIIIFLSIILLSSCSDKLSNSEAEDLISEHFNLPKKEIWVFEHNISHVGWKAYYDRYQPLVRKNLLITRKKGRGLWSSLYTSPTKKGKKYVVNDTGKKFEVELCTLKFGKVLSIHEEPQTNTAKVKFTLVRTNFTPFGELYRTHYDDKPLEKTITKSVLFKKFNDGWGVADFEKLEFIKHY